MTRPGRTNFTYSVGLALTALLIAAATLAASASAQSGTLPGRLITFKQVFDGWWDVACDTAPDGTDPRCYVQYVDPYSLPPKFRAAMVDLLYRRSAGGKGEAEPVITFDIEPGLSFARDVTMQIERADGTREAMAVAQCPTAKCIYAGAAAEAILQRWSSARTLHMKIKEHDGRIWQRRWPLTNIATIVRIIAEQRRLRGLP